MDIIHPLVQSYAERFSSPQTELLKEIEAWTRAEHPHAQMLSGHLQGRFLATISALLKPARILEIGTFVGFSALCLVEGLEEGGRLHTIELRQEEAATARGYFQRAGVAEKIILHVGNALDIIAALRETWDLVFIDADKINYTNYYRLVLPALRKNGLILADNVFFHGEVLQEPPTGINAQAIQQFNEMVSMDDSVEKIMLTLRDGLLMIRKK